jgi:hypothetical protein
MYRGDRGSCITSPNPPCERASETCLAARAQLSILLIRAQAPALRDVAPLPGPALLNQAQRPFPKRPQRPIDGRVIEAIGRVRAACADAPPAATPVPLEQLATPSSPMA